MRACPKPEPRSRVKRRQKRREGVLIARVRVYVAARDGYCRVPTRSELFGRCSGPSHWAHMAGARRSQTRGKSPEKRHAVTTTLMLCAEHHGEEERHRLEITPLSSAGAEGFLRFARRGVVWMEGDGSSEGGRLLQ